jgi:hypothetical protein
MTGEVLQLPSPHGLTYRVRIAWPDVGVAGVVDVKISPGEDFVSEVRELLEKLFPLLVEHDAVLLQFGPAQNLYPPPGTEVPVL